MIFPTKNTYLAIYIKTLSYKAKEEIIMETQIFHHAKI
jgi:hypothetical protein